MEQVFVINPKGGCGKTTIATQLAGYYANKGRRVLLADHDPQKSSSDWLKGRPSEVAAIDFLTLKPEQVIDTCDAEIIIHDMPAAYTLKHVKQIIRSGDRMLIPVLASPTDIKSCLRFVMGLYREGITDQNIEIGLIANKVRPNTKYFATLNEFLEKLELPIIGQLRDTQNYIRLMDKGLSIFDLPPGRVKRDVDEWFLIVEWLGI